MRKFWLNVAIDIILVAICVFIWKQPLANVISELLWLISIIAIVGVVSAVYMGWALTRAMNPKIKK